MDGSQANQILVAKLKNILDPDENVIIVAMQKRVGFGGALIDPQTVIVTSKRIIIAKKESLGLKTSYEFIPFNEIFNVKMEKGITSNAVVLSTLSYNQSEMTQRIDGLRYSDALSIFNYIDRVITQGGQNQQIPQKKFSTAFIYCKVCGARNDITAKYCWNCGSKL
ncbi:MAG: PH domain-containing protein [Candidatus Micrarchaeia archaeon]